MIDLQPDAEFAGYTIERRLGAGGWGTVYLAKDPRPSQFVALKLLTHNAGGDEARQRFIREGDLASRLEHPNIVTIHDRGVEDGIMWISMQYVPGTDASALTVPLVAERALWIGAGIAAALDYAHREGILHRDVKPSNILLGLEDGRPEQVALTDFGVARLYQDSAHLTATGAVIGTGAFVSPEQVSGAPIGHRSDQYSLACTLFQLFTGHGVFAIKDAIALMAAHVQQPPRTISDVRADLGVLDPVFARALSKQPDDRFDSCTEFVTAIERALDAGAAAGVPATGLQPVFPPTPPPQDQVTQVGGPTNTPTMPSAAVGRAPGESETVRDRADRSGLR
ncbi:serine/threonine protein kinase [Nocardia sp. NEAU-G5]|uniref:non-specific serine/threonine protein kinase n=1 Tax=Nocardia albiluteola TaxID=2842303 RepID=A0ABS6B7L9_9NOCA|nr:serine/threonine-protein kinase [Nocardia albiluteola]MBU3065365.1 serine/threonine protein kinase [Nocardia albiluteola]